jgi:hypothetical protein
MRADETMIYVTVVAAQQYGRHDVMRSFDLGG